VFRAIECVQKTPQEVSSSSHSKFWQKASLIKHVVAPRSPAAMPPSAKKQKTETGNIESTFCPYSDTSNNYDKTRVPLGVGCTMGSFAMSPWPLPVRALHAHAHAHTHTHMHTSCALQG
jgi:hypothetical protein